MFRIFITTCKSIDYLLVNLLDLNSIFCSSAMSANIKSADMLAVGTQDMNEEEISHAALLSSLIKIMEQQWSVPNFDGVKLDQSPEMN